jgi:hypothetical protein
MRYCGVDQYHPRPKAKVELLSSRGGTVLKGPGHVPTAIAEPSADTKRRPSMGGHVGFETFPGNCLLISLREYGYAGMAQVEGGRLMGTKISAIFGVGFCITDMVLFLRNLQAWGLMSTVQEPWPHQSSR